MVSHTRNDCLHLPTSIWQSSVGFRVLNVCKDRQRSRTQNSWRVHENSGPILARMWTKVREILGQYRRPLMLTKHLHDWLRHVSFRRYSPFSLEVAENRTNVEVFWTAIFGVEMASTFLWHTVSAICSYQCIYEIMNTMLHSEDIGH